MHFIKQVLKNILIIISCLFVFNACKSNKILITKTIQKPLTITKKASSKLTLSPNSKLIISKDNFNIINITKQKGQNLVLKFTYKTHPQKNIADANYSEILFIEIPNNKQNIHITQFKNINLWFARFCYCKDYVGFYRILNGNLNLSLNRNKLTIKLQFKFKNVPRVLNVINQEIVLNNQ